MDYFELAVFGGILVLFCAVLVCCTSEPGSVRRRAAKWVLIFAGLILLMPLFVLKDLLKQQR